ncbi:MAG TPA: TSUP family transporter [Anaeromyxobacteraceae bacterium]|nr:TSUP family transporter [Anaeromyxobacteraceae bacterium]
MTDPGLLEIALLTAVALVAGTVDAIAGGGGLLTLPALLASGLPPHLALGTNKGQSVFGSFAALVRFSRAGLVDGRRARVTFPAGLAGAFVGAALVLVVPAATLRPLVLVLLAAAALFIGFRPARPAPAEAAPPGARPVVAAVIALAIGAYDGFFGPGTGTFLIVAFVGLLGDGLARASASAKVVNFASNLAALVLFAARGVVLWKIAVPMAAAQLAGGWLGAHLAIRRGDALVRRVVVGVTLALAVKMAWDLR